MNYASKTNELATIEEPNTTKTWIKNMQFIQL